MPGRARIGPIDTSGLDGATTTTWLAGQCIEDLGGRAGIAGADLDGDDRDGVAQAHEVVLKGDHLAAGQLDARGDRVVGHRQQPHADTPRSADLVGHLRR